MKEILEDLGIDGSVKRWNMYTLTAYAQFVARPFGIRRTLIEYCIHPQALRRQNARIVLSLRTDSTQGVLRADLTQTCLFGTVCGQFAKVINTAY